MCRQVVEKNREENEEQAGLGSAGFTVMDLMVAMLIVSLLGLIAFPNISAMNRQLDVSQDTRILMQKFASWRSDAMMMRAPITVTFSAKAGLTPANYTVDYFSDGDIDEIVLLDDKNVWTIGAGVVGVPSQLRFSGLGLVTNMVSPSTDIGVKNQSTELGVRIFKSGTVEFQS